MRTTWIQAGNRLQKPMSQLSSLPSVERLLQTDAVHELIRKHGRPLTLDAIRLTLDEVREQVKTQPDASIPEFQTIIDQVESHVAQWERSSLKSVINATGVILHTNLGRAPLSEAAADAMDRRTCASHAATSGVKYLSRVFLYSFVLYSSAYSAIPVACAIASMTPWQSAGV